MQATLDQLTTRGCVLWRSGQPILLVTYARLFPDGVMVAESEETGQLHHIQGELTRRSEHLVEVRTPTGDLAFTLTSLDYDGEDAGLQARWNDLVAQIGDLGAYRERMTNMTEGEH